MWTAMTPILYSPPEVLTECIYEVSPLSCQALCLCSSLLLSDLMISNIILRQQGTSSISTDSDNITKFAYK